MPFQMPANEQSERLFNAKNKYQYHLSSVNFSQARIAPINPVKIPRLELCGAVLAVQAVGKILKGLDMTISEVTFNTDSKVVLGYIRDESRRFYANRVEFIRKISTPDQWRYVESSNNPADLATRGLKAKDLTESDWLSGPQFLGNTASSTPEVDTDQVTLSADDPEVRKEVKVCVTRAEPHDRGALHEEVFKRFSLWLSPRRATATFMTRARSLKMSNATDKTSKHESEQRLSPEVLTQTTNIISKAVQNEGFKEEVAAIASINPQNDDGRNGVKEKKRKLKKSHLYRLDPMSTMLES